MDNYCISLSKYKSSYFTNINNCKIHLVEIVARKDDTRQPAIEEREKEKEHLITSRMNYDMKQVSIP